MKIRPLLPALLAAAIPACASQPASLPALDYRGLYLFIDPRATPQRMPKLYHDCITALANPDIDGATIIVRWSDLYPAAGPGPRNYDWAMLDRWVGRIAGIGKKLSLGVVAGSDAPAWLFQPPDSVPAHRFTFNAGPVANHRGITRLLPSPWDPVFLRRYDEMIADLSRHLRAIGAYEAVRIVKFEGLNSITEELGVGATRKVDYDFPLDNSEYLTEGWAKAGLTPDRILHAWKDTTEHIAAAFPDKLLSVDILQNYAGFPPIDNAGRIVAQPPGGTDAITADLIERTLRPGPDRPGYYGRFSVQWDALSNRPNLTDPEVLRAGKMGAPIAWQMNCRMGADLGSGFVDPDGSFRPCRTADEYRAMLDNGIDLGGEFIEVFAANVVQFPAALHEPHRRILREAAR